MNKRLTEFEPGERLWIWRKQLGLTGIEAAAKLGVGRNALWEMEAGRREAWSPKHLTPPNIAIQLHLARRRRGWGLRETAQKLGVSHVTLLAWEREESSTLRDFWESEGFTFV